MDSTSKPIPENWARPFFTIWTGQALSLFGSSLVQFALVWWLTKETGSATVLATATLVALLPQIVFGPFIGALVDRWNRRLIMIVADGSIALATAFLFYLFAAGQVQIWHIYVVMFIRSLGTAFHSPAMTSSTSLMVPDKHLARLAGANQLLQGLVGIAAPPLGALLLEAFSTENVLLIDITTAMLAILPLLFIPVPQPARGALQERSTYWEDLREGFHYVVRWRGLLGVTILAMILNFIITPSSALLPLVITKIFNGGAQELGWSEALFGIGMIAGGILLGAWGGFKRRIITSLCGVIGIGIGCVMTGLVPADRFYILLTANFIIGFMQVFANGPLMAILQSTVAPDKQGRVFSLLGAGATAMMPLSLLVSGPIADQFGIRFWFIFGGAVFILMTVIAFFVPAIMNIENNHEAALTPVVE
ncbi:MAG TPA: MFS transporter [Anaerolineales bacterium]|jgi:DHA3 family macrolide efflux protein-like MFS transporter|nr:MFS transporter [Anaerolineales bacterium]HQX16236.1 MFS transporter [Anaerolineales bacterium]